MRKSYSKIRHIQESNLILERRRILNEQTSANVDLLGIANKVVNDNKLTTNVKQMTDGNAMVWDNKDKFQIIIGSYKMTGYKEIDRDYIGKSTIMIRKYDNKTTDYLSSFKNLPSLSKLEPSTTDSSLTYYVPTNELQTTLDKVIKEYTQNVSKKVKSLFK